MSMEKMNFFKLFPVICLLLPAFLFAQKHKEEHISRSKMQRLADYAFREKNFYTAIDLFEKLNAEGDEDPALFHKLGEANFSIREYKSAGIWYRKAFLADSARYGPDRLQYA